MVMPFGYFKLAEEPQPNLQNLAVTETFSHELTLKASRDRTRVCEHFLFKAVLESNQESTL
jgi:hypothetical protein